MDDPTPSQFRAGVMAFRQRESRDAMYRVATFLVKHFWGHARELADGIGVLLLTWNQAHYRYGPPDFERFERLLIAEAATLQSLRDRHISTFLTADIQTTEALFSSALAALEIAEGKSKERQSPVAVAKALHLLAPGFFPLWDKAIAIAYTCDYSVSAVNAYLRFMNIAKGMVEKHAETIRPLLAGKTPLKVLDEYNYAKFTKQWV